LVGCNGPKDMPNRGINTGLAYPSGPYGYAKHAVIANLGFLVKEDPDGAAGAANYARLDPVQRQLADYFNDDKVGWWVLTGAAGWCQPCGEEARTVPADSQKWEPMGVRFLTVLIQGFDEMNQTPSTMDDVNRWQQLNHEHIAIG